MRGYVEEGTTTTPFDLLTMNGVDRYQLAIEALRRADIALSAEIGGASGAFAVSQLAGAGKVVQEFEQKIKDHKAYIREEGNDPPEILEWQWTDGVPAPA